MIKAMKPFLVAGALLLAATPLMANVPNVSNVQHAADSQEIRHIIALDSGWRFHFGSAPAQVTDPGFDDSSWDAIDVPHSWNRVGYYRSDRANHLNHAETVNKEQGEGWYRLQFTPATPIKGKRIWLEFDAASRIASVWLNGMKLGVHAGGFSRFRFDATAAMRSAGENMLVVKADNSAVTGDNSPTADVLPLTGDFFVHGGLYRPARLVITDPVHFDLADHGGSGFSVSTRSLSADQATLAIAARLTNDSPSKSPVRLSASLIDRDGKIASTVTHFVTLSPQLTDNVALALDVAQPHAWQGVADPYLYTLSLEIADLKGRVLDRLQQPFGIRTIRIDPDHGLFLNGRSLQLRGVGYHQDREGKGWAISADDVAEDLAIMREMGVNSIRLTHYQHGQTVHDLADRYGLLLWDEIPLVSAWTRRGELEPRPALLDNARQQLRELIRQNGNHPSVITWGIANEVDFGNSFPAFLTGYPGGKMPDPMPVLHMLQDIAHAEDPTRPTALATCCEGRLFNAGVEIPTAAVAADLGGANRYFGWYFGVPDDLGRHLDKLHAARPGQPLSVTEYGAGGAISIHTDDVLGGPVDSRGRNQPEEYQSFIHERAWQTLDARKYLWASWLWNSFDFATTIRAEGDAQDINTKGLVTYDRQVRKDPYYFYKANWTATPTVHVTGRRYIDRAYRVTDVRVYSNADATELFVNGKSTGTRAACIYRICEWKAVTLQPGANIIEAQGRFPGGDVSDNVSWTLSTDAAANVRIDAGALVAAPASANFGSDAFFHGGTAGTLVGQADYGRPAVPARIAGTNDSALAATYREGTFRYSIPLAPGRYAVTLTFVEPSLGRGERVFDVTANGKTLLKRLAVAAAGGRATALRRSATMTVSGPVLDISFTPSKGQAIVSAIEISRVRHSDR